MFIFNSGFGIERAIIKRRAAKYGVTKTYMQINLMMSILHFCFLILSNFIVNAPFIFFSVEIDGPVLIFMNAARLLILEFTIVMLICIVISISIYRSMRHRKENSLRLIHLQAISISVAFLLAIPWTQQWISVALRLVPEATEVLDIAQLRMICLIGTSVFVALLAIPCLVPLYRTVKYFRNNRGLLTGEESDVPEQLTDAPEYP